MNRKKDIKESIRKECFNRQYTSNNSVAEYIMHTCLIVGLFMWMMYIRHDWCVIFPICFFVYSVISLFHLSTWQVHRWFKGCWCYCHKAKQYRQDPEYIALSEFLDDPDVIKLNQTYTLLEDNYQKLVNTTQEQKEKILATLQTLASAQHSNDNVAAIRRQLENQKEKLNSYQVQAKQFMKPVYEAMKQMASKYQNLFAVQAYIAAIETVEDTNLVLQEAQQDAMIIAELSSQCIDSLNTLWNNLDNLKTNNIQDISEMVTA